MEFNIKLYLAGSSIKTISDLQETISTNITRVAQAYSLNELDGEQRVHHILDLNRAGFVLGTWELIQIAEDAHMASMASVARMADNPVIASPADCVGRYTTQGVGENVHSRITAEGTVAPSAGPTGSPRRRNLATRPTQSQMVDTLVVETRAHGNQAASVLFERMQAKYAVNSEEAKAIARRVRAELGADGGAGEPQIP